MLLLPPESAPVPLVLAIVVAYNQQEVLERCLDALEAQERPVDGVLIVDNSEPVPASVAQKGRSIEARVRLLRSGANLGPAGGFALGIAMFQEEDEWTHAWLMDDDSYPHPEALGNLLRRASRVRPGSIVFPVAVNEDTGAITSHPGWGHAPLIDRLAVRLGGLPRSDLFWWVEDTEYLQNRLPKAGVLTVHASDARIDYGQPRRAHVKPAWKYYYEVRNTVWYRLYIQRAGLIHLAKLVRSVAKLAASAVSSGDRLANARMFTHGLLDGARGRLGATVRPPTRP